MVNQNGIHCLFFAYLLTILFQCPISEEGNNSACYDMVTNHWFSKLASKKPDKDGHQCLDRFQTAAKAHFSAAWMAKVSRHGLIKGEWRMKYCMTCSQIENNSSRGSVNGSIKWTKLQWRIVTGGWSIIDQCSFLVILLRVLSAQMSLDTTLIAPANPLGIWRLLRISFRSFVVLTESPNV